MREISARFGRDKGEPGVDYGVNSTDLELPCVFAKPALNHPAVDANLEFRGIHGNAIYWTINFSLPW